MAVACYSCVVLDTAMFTLTESFSLWQEHEAEGGRTALMKAARVGHLCTVQYLISQGNFDSIFTRDGKEPKPSKNEPCRNLSFGKNRTRTEPCVYRTWTEHKPNVIKVLRTRTEPYVYRTWTEHKPDVLKVLRTQTEPCVYRTWTEHKPNVIKVLRTRTEQNPVFTELKPNTNLTFWKYSELEQNPVFTELELNTNLMF